VETDLLRQTGGAGIEWFGRAATALYYAYKIAQRCVRAADKEAEVILPLSLARLPPTPHSWLELLRVLLT